nr:dihydropyrimidine dehydrogenase (NADP(+)), chloroplastic [Tanacetum cinerariifolium]
MCSGGGKVNEPDLSVNVNGLNMPNPFVIGSGPPGTNYKVMKKAFDEGWGAVIAKTVSLDAAKVINVTPRYARLRAGVNGSAKGQIIGWQNIELISDRPLETMLSEFKQLKEEYPDRILIASIMEEYNKAAWEELIDRVEQTGIDAIEVNFSCPHGMPERRMGAAVGQDCDLLEEVCGWVNAKATVPVWAKMTPNITDITQPARVSLRSGCEGIAAINTIMSVMGINLKTLHPEPCVEGVDFRRWQEKMHFLLSSMSVVYVLTTHIPEDGDDATVKQLRKRGKWDNDDYVCRGLILNVLNMVEHNNSSRRNDNKGKRKHHDNTRADPNNKAKPSCWKCGKTGHIKRDCKGVNVGNKANGSGTKDSVDGSSNSLKGMHGCDDVRIRFSIKTLR